MDFFLLGEIIELFRKAKVMLENLSLFIASSTVFILSPGVDTIFTLNKSLSGGVKAGVVASLGTAIGVLFHTLFAALGLSLILSQSGIAFSIVKYAGAAYLIYLGIKALREKLDLEEMLERGKDKKKQSLRSVFFMAVITNILNPKIALFFMAFFPQFVGKHEEGEFLPFFTLGGIYSLMCFIWLCLVAYFVSQFSKKIKKSAKTQKAFQYFSGLTFIGLGIKLAISEK